MNIVILAAGLGKRMYSDLPKVLHKMGGKPLLAHVIANAHQLKASRLIVVIGHESERLREVFANEKKIIWVKQEPQQGTGHAVMQALPYLEEKNSTLILYGDVPLTQIDSLKRLLVAAGRSKLGLMTAFLDQPYGYGRIIRRVNKIVRIVEEKDATSEERSTNEVNTGILAAPTTQLKKWLRQIKNNNAQREYYLTDIIALAISDGVEVVSVQPKAAWEILGVNSKSQLAKLERIYQSNVAANLLEQGVTLLDPARIDVRGELKCGKDVCIDINCIFEGQVELENQVKVGAQCILKNVRVGQGSIIAPFCHIEDAIISANCQVGPYARLRPGTQLHSNVHIGNFVEIKNSEIAANSKANHLTYIGDSKIGKNVNVGAGTITCNYDGANKHQTIIEDDVFIGSHSLLVAPIKVKQGATLGAGTTLTNDAPANALTLSRVKQVTIKGWQRPKKNVKSEK